MTKHVTPEEWERLGSRQVSTNGIELRVVDHGTGPLVVLCHGFPELGFSWRHQVRALAEAGYRTLTPDMRGYGGSSRPSRIEDYDILTLCADLAGLLDDAGAADAIFVGHDWGAAVVWQLALAHPERVRAVAGLSVPPTPRPPVPPMSILRSRLGEDFYMCWFQEPGVADRALGQDVRATLTATEIWSPRTLANSGGERPAPRWMSEDELEVYVTTFEATGFTGGLNYYRNLDRNWALTEHLDGPIAQPSLFLTGAEDPVRLFMPADHLDAALTDLRGHVVIEGGGHWIQQERPDEVTAALLDFVRSVNPPTRTP